MEIIFLIIHAIIGFIGVILMPASLIYAIWIDIGVGIKLFLTSLVIRVVWIYVTDLVNGRDEDASDI